MTTSSFFNNFHNTNEQQLVESLITESIKIYGYDVYYIPRTLNNKDEVYGEDTRESFENSFLLEMYIKNVEGFEGEGDFLSKFNIQIRDEMTLTVSRLRYDLEVGVNESFSRPREGDLIYFPLNGKIYNIKFVEHEAIFYQLGKLYTYDLKVELWEYSGERMNTGIDEIDRLETDYTNDMDIAVDANGNVILDEDGRPTVANNYNFTDADNQDFQTDAAPIIDWTDTDPFSEGNV